MSITHEELQKGLGVIETQMKDAMSEQLKNAAEQNKSAMEAQEKRIKDLAVEKDELTQRLATLEAKNNELNQRSEANKSFNDYLDEAIKENANSFASFKGGKVEKTIELKAAGDMSPSNFSGTSYGNSTTDFRQNDVLGNLYEQRYIADYLPKGTTDMGNIWYPVANGGEGTPAPWNSGAKTFIDFDFKGETVPVEWIAGIVRIPRQMLDDVKWMSAFLRANLWLELKKAENKQVLNGTGVSPQLKGLMTVASTYAGSKTIPIERIIDAAYGYVSVALGRANLLVLNPLDAVNLILNKASGSGEYDNPLGTVTVVNGQLTIAGLTIVTTNEMTQGSFLVGDATASQFITRLSPEIRFFEQDEDNVQKNMITVRVEERAALATYRPTWWIKGTLTPTT